MATFTTTVTTAALLSLVLVCSLSSAVSAASVAATDVDTVVRRPKWNGKGTGKGKGKGNGKGKGWQRPSSPSSSCAPGKYYAGAVKGCVKCEAGSYSWGGTVRRCSLCPPGTYTKYRGVVDRSLCLSCPAGRWSTRGSASCHLRRRRRTDQYYASAATGDDTSYKCGSSTFWIIPPAGVSYLPDSVCVSPITGCPDGSRLKVWARRAVCESVTTGKVLCANNAVYDGVDRCLSCVPGSALVKHDSTQALALTGGRSYTCERCTGNSVSAGGRSKKCTPCKCGYARNAMGDKCERTVPPGVTITC